MGRIRFSDFEKFTGELDMDAKVSMFNEFRNLAKCLKVDEEDLLENYAKFFYKCEQHPEIDPENIEHDFSELFGGDSDE